MSMSQRGLLSTMRLECWCNKSIPANATELASYLGLSEAELNANLTVNVLAFFKELRMVPLRLLQRSTFKLSPYLAL